MKYNDRYTGKLILRKSSNYMILSLIIFVSMIALICFSILFYVSYQRDNSQNYMDNEIVHILSFEGNFEDNSYREMNSQDYEKLYNVLETEDVKGKVSFFYMFNGAVTDEDDIAQIIGISKEGESYISEAGMEDGIVYSNYSEDKEIKLIIPKIQIDSEGNVSANESEELILNQKSAIENKVIDCFEHDFEDLNKFYVTENTFLEILKLSSEKYDGIESITDRTIADSVIIDSAYVSIDDIYEVENMADVFTDEGYDISYTFSAFDAMGNSIRKNGILFFSMIIILLTVSSINLVLSLISYLSMGQKDIGVLKFLGYTEKRIYNIYKRNIDCILGILWIVAVLCIVMLTYVTLDSDYMNIIIALVLSMTCLLFIIRTIVNKGYLAKIVNKEILYLIKESKQFE